MNNDSDMKQVKSADTLARELRDGKTPRGTYGDSIGGRSFSDDQAALLALVSAVRQEVSDSGWHEVWAGPGQTCWTVINCAAVSCDDRKWAAAADYEADLVRAKYWAERQPRHELTIAATGYTND